jgi:uncharacterized protein (TIGR02284 family)
MENTVNSGTVEVLNDLIEINNDRIEGYEKAARETVNDPNSLNELYTKMAAQSKDIVSELRRSVTNLGGTAEEGTTMSGKIYRAWMDVKSAFTTDDTRSTLELCEFGEDAAQKAYTTALASDEFLPTDIRTIIANQKADLKLSHDVIKRYRDASVNN